MGISVRKLFRTAGLKPRGPVRWGVLPEGEAANAGVYVVAMTKDVDAPHGLAWMGCSHSNIKRWLDHLEDKMQVDGQPASARAVEQRLAQFWFETEPVVYIGQTGRKVTVRGRVSLMYQHRLGERSPHAGGHWLHALSALDTLWIFWAPAETPRESEHVMLTAFSQSAKSGGRQSKELRFILAIPFANRELRRGQNKPHGLRFQTSPRRHASLQR
jgi:hypothetical protein